MTADEKTVYPSTNHPFFLHIAISGAIWLLMGLSSASLFIVGNGNYLWLGRWARELSVFQLIRHVFRLSPEWAPKRLDVLFTPTLPDALLFIWFIASIGSLLALVLAVAGWITGFTNRRTRRGTARGWWPFCIQVSAFLAALLINGYGRQFMRLSLWLEALVVITLICLVAVVIARPSRWIMSRVKPGRFAPPAALAFIVLAISAWPALKGPARKDPPLSPTPATLPVALPERALLITIDATRADHTSMGGYFRDTTPALARLASQGVYFENCLVPAPWTLPSMGAVLTGLSPLVHGMEYYNLGISGDITTLAETLRDKGVHTAAFFTGPYLLKKYGFNRGFQDYDDFGASLGEHEPIAEKVTEKVLAWLDRNAERPFFVSVHFFDPHRAYSPPPPYDTIFQEREQASKDSADMQGAPDYYSSVQHLVNLYDGEIAYTDAQIERILDRLKSLGIFDDMLIIITADHGDEFLEHGMMSHSQSLYQELIHVPLVVHFPRGLSQNLPSGARSDYPVTHEDIFPTVLEAFGLLPPPDREGTSLFSVPSAPGSGCQRARIAHTIYFNYYKICIVTDNIKYIQTYNPDSRSEELYDLETDPGEKINLVNDRPEIAESMRRELFKRIRELRSKREAYGHNPEPLELDVKAIEKLKALGYLE